VFSGRGLCFGLITRPEEFYQVWCVWVRSRNLNDEKTLAHYSCRIGGGGGTEQVKCYIHGLCGKKMLQYDYK